MLYHKIEHKNTDTVEFSTQFALWHLTANHKHEVDLMEKQALVLYFLCMRFFRLPVELSVRKLKSGKSYYCSLLFPALSVKFSCLNNLLP